jgi:hypothetical protein
LVVLYALVSDQEALERAQPLAHLFKASARSQLHVGDQEPLLARREEADRQELHEPDAPGKRRERQDQHREPVAQAPTQHRRVETD